MVKTPDERVRDSEARKVKKGGRRMPGGVMDLNTSDALEYLTRTRYAMNATQCISRAIIDAAKRRGWEEREGED